MATIDIRGATVSAADPPIATNPNADLAIKAPVRVATTGANINLQTIGLGPIDGVTLAAGDRVLVKDQTDQTTNGIYNATTGTWTRTIDANNNSQLTKGMLVEVTDGAINSGFIVQLTTANPVILGTSNIVFAATTFAPPTKLQIGLLPFVQANSYSAGGANSLLVAVRGTNAVPITDSNPVAIFQSVANVTTNAGNAGFQAQTLYASIIKLGTTNLIDYRAFFAEAVDNAGGSGSSIAGGRFTASLLLGTGGNATGVTTVGIATAPYNFVLGTEAQVWNNTGTDATTTISNLKFAVGVLASAPGTNRPDAAYFINNNDPVTPGKGFISGYVVPSNGRGAGLDTVIDTAFRCDASLVNGIDLTRGTYSGFAIKTTGFSVDPSGNIASGTIASGNITSPQIGNGAGQLQLGSSTGTIKFGGSGTFAATAATSPVFTLNAGPTGLVGTAIAKWLKFIDSGGTTSYVPVWQ